MLNRTQQLREPCTIVGVWLKEKLSWCSKRGTLFQRLRRRWSTF